MNLPIITPDMVRAWQPCFDPGGILPEGGEGTALDVLKMDIDPKHKLRIVFHDGVLPDRVFRQFAYELLDALTVTRSTKVWDKALAVGTAWEMAYVAADAMALDVFAAVYAEEDEFFDAFDAHDAVWAVALAATAAAAAARVEQVNLLIKIIERYTNNQEMTR